MLDAAGENAKHLLTTLANRFGAARLMWGSDYPQVHNRPYSDLVALAHSVASELTKPEQDDFMGGASLRF